MRPRQVAQVRPRFGKVTRPDGAEVLVQFVPVDGRPGRFLPVDAGDGATPVRIYQADLLTIDVLGPGQSIVLAFGELP